MFFFLWRPTLVVRVSIGFCSRVPFKGRYEVPEWGSLKSHGLEKLPSELDQGLGVSLWGHLGFAEMHGLYMAKRDGPGSRKVKSWARVLQGSRVVARSRRCIGFRIAGFGVLASRARVV